MVLCRVLKILLLIPHHEPVESNIQFRSLILLHHMAQQPKSGPGLPTFLGFRNSNLFT
jgi:hypothetical protein